MAMSDPTLGLIMKYLKQRNYSQSLVALEKESDTNFNLYCREIQFFRKILLRGDFSQAAKFLQSFESRLQEHNFQKILLEVSKQKLYELIENPDQTQLKVLFEKEIINYCSEQDYQNFFTYLTCRSVRDIPGLAGWTVVKGRLRCFQTILPYLDGIIACSFQREDVQGNLQDIVQEHFKAVGGGTAGEVSDENHLSINRSSHVQKKPERQYRESGYQNAKSSMMIKSRKQEILQDDSKTEIPTKNSRVSNTQKTSKKVEQSQPQKSYKDIELDLSESKMQKSYQVISDKRPRMYANLAANKNKGQSSMQFDADMKSSTEKYSKSEAFKVNPYESQQIEENSEQYQKSQRSEAIEESEQSPYKFKKPSPQVKEAESYEQTLQEEVKRNIAYLQQNNSAVYKDEEDNQNFTFSNHQVEEKPRRVEKLASISDVKAIRTCQYSESGRYFALGTNSSYLKIFDIKDLYEKNQPNPNLIPIYQIENLHLKSIFCLDWSVNERAILTCSNDLTIRLTNFQEGMSSHRSNVIGRHQGCIRMVKFNSLETKVVSCDDKGLIKLWDIGKAKCTDLKGHKDGGVSAFKLAENQGESILYSVGKDSLIKKWDVRTGNCQAMSKKQDSELTYIASNTDRIVVSHKNGTVSFFNNQLQLDHSVQIHEQEIRSIDGNSIDGTLLAASFDGHISMFDQKGIIPPFYHQHNQLEEDKVVFATFMQNPDINGFASASTLGICNLYSYQ